MGKAEKEKSERGKIAEDRLRTLGLILCAGMFAVPSAAKLKVGIDVDIANDDIKSSAAWTKGAQLLDGTKITGQIVWTLIRA